jgi:Cu(I)/Ag(I) efflux system periplasmic protein CusF
MMKALVFAIAFASSVVAAHAGEMKGMDMKGMDMKDMSPSRMAKDATPGKHTAKGTVKSVDNKAQTVTLDHEPVQSMSWPAMTMTFKVRDKAVMDKLAQGRKVEVDFEQRGKDYVITGAK